MSTPIRPSTFTSSLLLSRIQRGLPDLRYVLPFEGLNRPLNRLRRSRLLLEKPLSLRTASNPMATTFLGESEFYSLDHRWLQERSIPVVALRKRKIWTTATAVMKTEIQVKGPATPKPREKQNTTKRPRLERAQRKAVTETAGRLAGTPRILRARKTMKRALAQIRDPPNLL